MATSVGASRSEAHVRSRGEDNSRTCRSGLYGCGGEQRRPADTDVCNKRSRSDRSSTPASGRIWTGASAVAFNAQVHPRDLILCSPFPPNPSRRRDDRRGSESAATIEPSQSVMTGDGRELKQQRFSNGQASCQPSACAIPNLMPLNQQHARSTPGSSKVGVVTGWGASITPMGTSTQVPPKLGCCQDAAKSWHCGREACVLSGTAFCRFVGG